MGVEGLYRALGLRVEGLAIGDPDVLFFFFFPYVGSDPLIRNSGFFFPRLPLLLLGLQGLSGGWELEGILGGLSLGVVWPRELQSFCI